MAHDNRLVTECRSRADMPAGGQSTAVGIVSSVTWTIGISVEANLWPSLVTNGLDYHETNQGRLLTTHPIRKSVRLCACRFVRSGEGSKTECRLSHLTAARTATKPSDCSIGRTSTRVVANWRGYEYGPMSLSNYAASPISCQR